MRCEVAALVESLTECKVCAVIKLLQAKKLTLADILWQLYKMYGPGIVNYGMVMRWAGSSQLAYAMSRMKCILASHDSSQQN